MNVLLVTSGYPPEHSGSGGRIHELYRRLQRADHRIEWSVLTKRRSRNRRAVKGPRYVLGCYAGEPRSKISGSFSCIPEGIRAYHATKRGIFDAVDLVHLVGFSWMHVVICHYATNRGLPILRELTSVADGGMSGRLGGLFFRKVIRWLNKKSDLLVAISPALEKTVRASGIRTPIWCRPNPVSTERFRPPNGEERGLSRKGMARWFPGLSDADVLILHVGRIRPLKNQLLVVQAMAHLPRSFRLLLVGPVYPEDEWYLRDIRRAISQTEGLAKRVHIEAELYRDVGTLMHGADIFVFPSSAEGLGNVMLEALASGLPVVASDLPGITDWLIEAGTNGVLSVLEPKALAKRIEEVVPLLGKKALIAEGARLAFAAPLIDRQYAEILWQLAGRRNAAK